MERLIRRCLRGRPRIGTQSQGRSQGGRGKSPPPKPKKLLEKNGVTSEGSIFSNKFPKIKTKIQFFYRIFIKNFLKISQQLAYFVQMRGELTQGLLNFLKNMLK